MSYSRLKLETRIAENVDLTGAQLFKQIEMTSATSSYLEHYTIEISNQDWFLIIPGLGRSDGIDFMVIENLSEDNTVAIRTTSYTSYLGDHITVQDIPPLKLYVVPFIQLAALVSSNPEARVVARVHEDYTTTETAKIRVLIVYTA